MTSSIVYNNKIININYDDTKKTIRKLGSNVVKIEYYRNIKSNIDDILDLINERPKNISIGEKSYSNIIDIMLVEDFQYKDVMNLEIHCSL